MAKRARLISRLAMDLKMFSDDLNKAYEFLMHIAQLHNLSESERFLVAFKAGNLK